jgi:integrase
MIEKVDGIECFVIDGKTSGLKRQKGKTDHIPHHVPITRHMKKILKQIKDYSDGEKYLFMQIRQSRYEHLDPSAPNNYFRRLGYQGEQVAHGVRTLAETIGQDELGYMSEIIQRQLGHLVGDKTRRAYDRSLLLKTRKEFLDDWSTYLIDNGLRI